MAIELAQIPQNYKKNVDWILGAYEDSGVSFPNGFQKDAIQNAAGARKAAKWKNWRCDISIKKNKKGIFLIVEDSGTVGLTGNNITMSSINSLMNEGKELPSSERLARFSSMFNSGGNEKGGGLYGAGKSVYSVASESYTYYYDSLREDGLYVANFNKCGQINEKALEGSEAKKFILDNTGLSEKKTVGTRVIIESPKKELVESIKDGSIKDFILESWWLIILRLEGNSGITVNGEEIVVPKDLKKCLHKFELQNPEEYSSNYKVKHFGLYVYNDESIWEGISYYRKGMKIGEVDLKDIPEKLRGKFWGYVEVEEDWEDSLSDIEDKIHFGVSKGKKGRQAYQNLRNYCNEKCKANFIEWGYIKDRENEDKKLKEELKQIAEEIQDLFDNLGFEDLGKGPQKADFDVRWQNIEYPIEGSEEVTTGDNISFSMRISSSYSVDKRFELNLNVLNATTGEYVSTILSKKITVKSNTVYKEKIIYTVTPESAKQYAANKIVLVVKVIGSGKEKKKELPFFYDIERPDNSRSIVSLVLHQCDFPREGSRRVNFDERIENISYRIENKRNHLLSYRLNISIHNASDPTCPKIEDIASVEGEIAPFEDVITEPVDYILFARNKYETYLTEGVLELRARLIAKEDDEEFEKGDKIGAFNYKIFFNMDEKNGKNDAFDVKSIDAPEDYRRSWSEPGTSRTIYLNLGHVAYSNVQDYPELQHEYLREQMLKQYVLIYLQEGKYDMFNSGEKSFIDAEPQEAADIVIQKIENVYYKSLE